MMAKGFFGEMIWRDEIEFQSWINCPVSTDPVDSFKHTQLYISKNNVFEIKITRPTPFHSVSNDITWSCAPMRFGSRVSIEFCSSRIR